ncbi:TonB-dependent receptor domain-containing protein [Lacinutrix undariae]
MKSLPYIILTLASIFPLSVFSQNSSIKGQVVDNQNSEVSYANVMLLTTNDSTIVKGVSTNELGNFKFDKIEASQYLIKVSFLGYHDFFQTITVKNDLILNTISLTENLETLNEVNLVYKQPTLKKEADRLIFNVENSALIEGNILQVLKNTPGVIVLDNEFLVKNIQPTIYINDRRMHLSATELSQLFEGASANNIQSIEVITNPSAKYDADSGVVVNIKMSKNLIAGYKGSVFANYTQGVFPRYNFGTSHFFKTEKLNVYVNYNYTDSKINRDSDEAVFYLDQDKNITETWRSNINRNTWSKTHNLNANISYAFDDKNSLEFSSSLLWLPDFEYLVKNRTTMFDVNNDLSGHFDTNNLSFDEKENVGLNIDYLHLFKNPEEKLAFNAHYTFFNYERQQDVDNNYFDADAMLIQNSVYNTFSDQDTNIFTTQLDYTLPIGDVAVFETGLKTSSIDNSSDIKHYNIISGTPVLNTNNTNAFNYDETIFAGYVNYTRDWKKWNLAIGVRAEQTNVDGYSVTEDETNSQDYLKWFPSTSITFRASDNLNLYTNYKKSIDRPSYEYLNPFKFYINDNTLYLGNPNLQPVINDYMNVGISFKDTYTIESYYSKAKNNIYELPVQDNTTNLVTYSPTNFDETIEYGFDFVYNSYLSKRWFIYAVTSFYNKKDVRTFTTANTVYKRDMWSNYTAITNDVSLLKDNSLSVNFSLMWLGKNMQGFRVVENRIGSNLAISKTVLKQRGVVSLYVNDIFNAQDFDISSNYLFQNNSVRMDADNRYIKLGFRYNFGNVKLKANSYSKTLDETDRLNK